MLTGHDEMDSSARLRAARLAKIASVEWLGQTAASIFWIVSVFVYGISAPGDWLQLCAASAWLVANIASAVHVEPR